MIRVEEEPIRVAKVWQSMYIKTENSKAHIIGIV